jgi:hypothetical protein
VLTAVWGRRRPQDGLCGNSRTAMIATVASSSVQYSHTINTLKYADRAKEIKTHVRRNVGTVDTHITEYQRVIDNLQVLHPPNHPRMVGSPRRLHPAGFRCQLWQPIRRPIRCG